MKKRLIIEIVCGIIIFVVGYFVGDASAVKRVNTAVDNKVSQEATSTQTAASDTKSDEQKIYKLGEEGASGNLVMKILGVQETNTIEGGDSSQTKTTTQKYIVVKLQLTNKAQAAIQYSYDDFVLGDSKTKTQYKANTDAGAAANNKETIYKENNEFVGELDDINPNTPKQTYIVFEVPKDFSLQNAVLINTKNGKTTGIYLK